MATQIQSRIQKLESALSQISGVQVEITFRWERSFTYSFEGKNEKAEMKIKDYFSGQGTFTDGNGCSGYCPEIDFTCLFHEV